MFSNADNDIRNLNKLNSNNTNSLNTLNLQNQKFKVLKENDSKTKLRDDGSSVNTPVSNKEEKKVPDYRCSELSQPGFMGEFEAGKAITSSIAMDCDPLEDEDILKIDRLQLINASARY